MRIPTWKLFFGYFLLTQVRPRLHGPPQPLLAPQRHLCAMLAATHHASLGDSESVALHRPFVAVIDAGCDVS